MRNNKGVINSLCLSILGIQIYYFFLSKTTENISQSAHLNRNIDNKQNKTMIVERLDSKENDTIDLIRRKKDFNAYYQNTQSVKKINCTKVINDDQNELLKLKVIYNSNSFVRTNFSAEFYTNITNNCTKFRDTRGYVRHAITKEEYEFPIAFSIIASTGIEQVERLLRLIYRPHNYYCIHIDSRINIIERIALRKIANCLTNVFIAHESYNITIGNYTYLKAELGCMRTLYPFKRWQYYINLSDQGFPLKTNRQIVDVLKVMKGANIVEGSVRRARLLVSKNYNLTQIDPPHDIQLAEGSMHIVVNRHFVDFCLHDTKASDFLNWLLTKKDLEKTYFSSLNFNPHLRIPGTFIGEPEPYCLKPLLVRYLPLNFPGERFCQLSKVNKLSKERQYQCMFGVEDLPKAYNGFDLFAYNFNLDYNSVVLQCLEEVLYACAWKEYVDNAVFDTSYYAFLHYSKMQLKP